jgi:hypothetical protein
MPANPNTADPVKPRRRWFQFRLRTLLIGMVLLSITCGYVGQQGAIVAQRAAERHLLEHCGAGFFEDGVYSAEHAERRPSWLREFLGDRSVAVIRLPLSIINEERERAAENFPESEIQYAISDGDY